MNSSRPRVIALLLLTAGAVGVLVLSFRPSRVEQAVAEPPAEMGTDLPERTSAAAELEAARGADAMEPPLPADRLDPNSAAPESGTGEAYLAHLGRSVIMANAEALQLNGAQQERLVEDFLEFQEIHAELAEQHLQETGYDGSTVHARVPPFLSEGKALRDLFYERLRRDFPDGAFERITENLDGFFDTHFRGYGITEQVFTITRSYQHPDAFQVEWQALPVEGQTPSREEGGTSYGGSSGVVLYSRDQIKNGEFRFLGELIDRRFP